MSVRHMTLEQIRLDGLKALASQLGTVGMVRFLQQFETGQGDYSVERRELLGRTDVTTLAERIQQQERES